MWRLVLHEMSPCHIPNDVVCIQSLTRISHLLPTFHIKLYEDERIRAIVHMYNVMNPIAAPKVADLDKLKRRIFDVHFIDSLSIMFYYFV